jgi:hypothetical protein
VATDLGSKFDSFGGSVRKTATNRGVEHTRESLQAIGEELEARIPRYSAAPSSTMPDGLLASPQSWKASVMSESGRRSNASWLHSLPCWCTSTRRKSCGALALQERGAREANYLERAEAHSTERDVIAELPQLANLVLATEGRSIPEWVREIEVHLGLGRP